MDNTKGRKKKEIGYDSPFAERLRMLLTENKITQPVLAEAVGVSRQAVGQWKDGNTVPDILDAQKIADYFQVSTDYLLGRTDTKSTDANVKAACEYTGLSEEACEQLNSAYMLLSDPKASLQQNEYLQLDNMISSGFLLRLAVKAEWLAKYYYVNEKTDKEDALFDTVEFNIWRTTKELSEIVRNHLEDLLYLRKGADNNGINNPAEEQKR